jgi:predicted enzyme related to lactoylglutathione lyase
MILKEICMKNICISRNEITGGIMKLGEVGLLTNDVVRLANFYKLLLGIDNDSNDTTHQTIIAEETMLTIYNDGSIKNNENQNMCLAFTVDDINFEYEKIVELGVDIIEEPKLRPWGTWNMSFYDPDSNVIYLRSFNK